MNYSRTYGYSHGMKMTDSSSARDDMSREVPKGDQIDAEQRQTQGESETTSRVQRNVGFTMFRPDEGKRAHLEQVGKREMELADARREARRLHHIDEKPRSVGGTGNYSTAVMQKQKAVTAATTGREVQKKREKWQREKREAEEREHRERKEKARAQAERNEVLRVVRAQELEDKHREAHREKNKDFLDRLERGSKYSGYY